MGRLRLVAVENHRDVRRGHRLLWRLRSCGRAARLVPRVGDKDKNVKQDEVVFRRRDLLPYLRGHEVRITIRRPFGVLSWRKRLGLTLFWLAARLAALGARIAGASTEVRDEVGE